MICVPKESDIDEIKEDGKFVIIQFDLSKYNREHNNRAVKKTLSIPEWLNKEALEKHQFFSGIAGRIDGESKINNYKTMP